MKDALVLQKIYFLRELKYSLRYLIRDKRKLVLAFLVFIFIPSLNAVWKFIDSDMEVPYYNNLQVLAWTMLESICMVLTSTAWYLSAARKDHAIKLIALGSIYYWIFIFLTKLPLEDVTSLYEDVAIFVSVVTVFTLLVDYIKSHYIHKNINYKDEYDGMVYDYHHLCRGFTKTVEGLNHLKKNNYISDAEYNNRLSSTTKRFDEFAMKIHDRYQDLI